MEAFHFIRPWWLLAIPALLLLSPWLWRYLNQRSGWQKVLAPHLSSVLLGATQTTRRWLPLALIAMAWLLSSLALAGPSWERLPAPAYQNQRAAVIIIDMSMNTRASDISPDRLTRLRFKALDLLDDFSATEVGLVAYAGDAFTISPLTRDYGNMRSMIPALAPEIMPSGGNYPLRAFTEAHRMVTDAGYEQAEFYWFSAGMRQDDYQEIRRFLRGKGHRVSNLLAGDDDATPIRLASGDMLRDQLGRLSMAQLNSSLFQRLSNEYNGRTVRLRADHSDIDYILAQAPLHEGVQRQDDNLQSDQWLDRGPYLAWLLLPLALYAARKGVLLTVLLLPLTMMLYTPLPAHAAIQSNSDPGLRPFSNQQQRAAEFYRQGDYQRAAELFRDPLMRGNALYRADQFGAALDAYQQAGDSAERWYNSGNALAQLGELDAASDAFAQALAKRPDWQQAADNKAMVDELREQQQQESGEDEQDGDPSSQDEQQDDQPSDESQPSDDQMDGDTQQSDTEGSQDETEPSEQDAPDETESDQTERDVDSEQTPRSPTEQEQQIQDALEDQQLSDEQRAELEQLLRRVQSDPAVLLRNRMRLEAERRQQGLPPRGVRRP